MSDPRFTENHEWLRIEDDTGVIGISNYAQEKLGDIVYVELPEIGRKVAKGAEIAVVESVKAASEVYAPASGEVIAVNDTLGDNPAEVNTDAMGKGWFCRIRLNDPTELGTLMDEAAYRNYVEGLE